MPYLGNEVAPLGQALEGKELKLDSDGDSSIQASTDDTVVFKTNSNTALSIDANGHITKPLQPAFFAKLSSDITNIATDGSVTIVFDTEIFDQNADYNNSNGYFTAPITGRYAIYFNTRVDSIETNVTWWQWTIGASNRNISILTSAQQFDATTEQFGQNISMIIDMDANDTVHMSWYQNGGTQSIDISNHVTYFGGYLVC